MKAEADNCDGKKCAPIFHLGVALWLTPYRWFVYIPLLEMLQGSLLSLSPKWLFELT